MDGAIANTLRSDALIVGGGLVGGTLACALGHAGLRVVVVETDEPRTVLDAGFDGRASAIACTSRRLLERIGVWDRLADEASPMLDIRVSDGASRFFLHYDHREVGDQPFGHMVENRVLRRAILEEMQTLETVRVSAPDRVVELTREAAVAEARLANTGPVAADLIVAADGRASRTREDARIRVTGWRYAQAAIVCTVEHERPHDHIAHEHFLPAGPFAILPLLGNRASIVWTERAERAPAFMALDDSAFIGELVKRFGDFLGEVRLVGPRWCYPLGLQFAERATAPRLALVGDALHGMHPIAGQGLNMGFRDVAALVDAVEDAARLGQDIGTAAVLARYERARRFDNLLMLAMTDGLNRLFSNDIAPIRVARDIGLGVVNRANPVKKLFMRHAMGEVGELPRLMRA